MCATILHVDINNFYAGVEIRDCPSLAGLPLVVGGDIEARHGIVLAKIILQRVSGFKPQKPSCLRLENAPIFRLSPRISKNTSKPCVKAVKFSCASATKSSLSEWMKRGLTSRLMPRPSKTAAKLRTGFANAIAANSVLRLQSGSVSAKFCQIRFRYEKPDATTVIPKNGFKEKIFALPVESLLLSVRRQCTGLICAACLR